MLRGAIPLILCLLGVADGQPDDRLPPAADGKAPRGAAAIDDAPSAPQPPGLDGWYPLRLAPPFIATDVPDDPAIIHAGNARFAAGDPPQIPLELEVIADRDLPFTAGWWIIHFRGGVDEAAKLLLDETTGPIERADGSALARWYLPNRALIAFIESWDAHDAIAESDLVDWLGPYHPAYKLSPSIGAEELRSPERRDRRTYLLDVDIIPGHPVADLRAALVEIGVRVVTEVHRRGKQTHDQHYLVVEALPHRIIDIAKLEGVRLVQESGDGLRLFDLSGGGKLQSRTLAADDGSASPIITAASFPLWLVHDLQGQGQLVGVVDTNVDANNVGVAGCGFGFPDTAIDNWGFAVPNLSRVLLGSIGAGGVSLKIPRADLLGGAAFPGSSAGEHGQAVAGAAAADFYGNNDTKWWEHDVDAWESWAPSNFSGLLGPGIAHESQIFFTPVMNSLGQFRWEQPGEFPVNMGITLDNMAAAGVCTTSHSVGLAETNNVYSQTSVAHDLAGFDNPSMLQCMAAGNSGAVANALTSQAVIKNNVAVGASDDVLRPEDRVTFSSIGPAFDGRRKPDIMAPGSDTFPRDGATQSLLILPQSNGAGSGSCAYQWTSGTSFSAPTITGAGALVHQYFEEGRYGGATPIFDPSAALMRAALVNAGHRLTGANLGNNQYPNVYQGWGEPNLSDVLDLPGGARRLIAFDVASAGGFTGPSASVHSRQFAVNSSGQPLRIALSWTDEPGTAGTGKKLINDLHLAVTAPGGATYLGNVFDLTSGTSTTGGAADTINNTECVILASPASGTWTVVVDPSDGNYSVPQGYALVITGDVTESVAPVPPVANFSGAPTAGSAPLAVAFTDTSSGSVTSWSWTFGDGGTSTAENPNHTYAAAGTYDVSLTVGGPAGGDTETKIGYITVTAPPPPPVAAFSGVPTLGVAPLAVSFTDLSTGSVTSWSWTFGDGGTSTAQHPTHIYTAAGSYTVSLTATGPGGADTETQVGYVTVDPPVSGALVYISFDTATTVPGVGTVQDEDIVTYDPALGTWALFFDGSDVGLGATDVWSFSVLADGSVVMGFDTTTFSVPGAGTVEDSDLVRFTPTSTGSTTAGTFTLYFDGSDVGLTTSDEEIDGVHVLDGGGILISTLGSVSVTGVSAVDEDILLFAPTSLGATTAGTWSLHFDGSDVALNNSSNEDVDALTIDFDGTLVFSTTGSYSAAGGSGDDEDISRFTGTFGSATAGSIARIFDLSTLGIATSEDVDGVSIR